MPLRSLHITNGDSAADIMAAAGISGHILPWRDVLHDGPVPAGADPEALAVARARFLAQPPVLPFDRVLHGFRTRDDTLRRYREFDAVTLWLEHDLYDQLQLLQILHRFAGVDRARTPLRLICIDRFPGVQPFYGLGQLTPVQMASLAGSGQEMTESQLDLGRRGWQAFTAETPLPLVDFLSVDLSPLPFLEAALWRHLQEFPDLDTGLSRHERQILEMIDAGIHQPVPLFTGHQEREAAPYLGDWSFWSILERLANTPQALIHTETGQPFVRPPTSPGDARFLGQQIYLTPLGRAVLSGEADWAALNPPDRWLGGVRLHPDRVIWRWDPRGRTPVPQNRRRL